MDIKEQLNLTKVINADGRMTILGVSKFNDLVGKSMINAGQSFFIMKELEDAIDKDIAKVYGGEDAHVVNSASAGIALSVAAIIYKNRVHDVNRQVIYNKDIVIPKGHSIDYGAPIEDMIYLVGGNPKEAGYSNRCSAEDLDYQVDSNTAAILYVVSHHAVQKQMLSLEEAIKVAKARKVPIIVDCAGEEDIKKYLKLDIDLVVFSGAKAFEGPTSGIVFGKKEHIENIRKHHKTIGRAMKIGKENLVGIHTALLDYSTKKASQLNALESLKIMQKCELIKCEINKDGTRDIERIKFSIINVKKTNCEKLSEKLKKSNPSIYLRDYFSKQGWLEIDLRSITFDDLEVIQKTIKKILEEV